MIYNVYLEAIDQNEELTTYRISKEDTLGVCLVEFFGDEALVVTHLRDGFEDEEYFYFTAGYGYNIIDTDLLDGDGSGKTKKAFEALFELNIHY